MKIPYEQLTTKEALKTYCDWLVSQQTDDFFVVLEHGEQQSEWYMIFYPVRTLLLGYEILKNEEYLNVALKYVDEYIEEQLPNGGFTSTFRRKPSAELTQLEIEEIFRTQNVNIADNGSNVMAVIHAASYVTGEKRTKYIESVRRWFDNFVMIWSLPSGGYANGLWEGEISGKPYTCAIATVSVAFAAFSKLTGEYSYAEKAEKCMEFQCSNWTDDSDGRPLYFDEDYRPKYLNKCFKQQDIVALDDFGHTFYLIEGMVWTHYVTKNNELKKMLEKKLKSWIFGTKGILSQWGDSWFSYMIMPHPWWENENSLPTSRHFGLRLGWEMAKSNGIIYPFMYYLNNIDNDDCLRRKVDTAIKYLSNPLKCRMSGVMSDPEESYGAFAVQSTGFGGLSLAEAIKPNSVFECIK